jgi:UDP-N-acetylglucosamine--N-acetylmuramyl-(pentapeptide) pyrophosphoryl-undecaprenol N-acetylglucosamine transferase
MKIVLTGGGTGGHFYPLIAVAHELYELCEQQKIVEPQIYYIGPVPYDKQALLENNIRYIQSPAGKMRRYASIWNVLDMGKTLMGIFRAIYQLYVLFPDVIFSKGGYAAFPTLVAARLLGIPVVVHESDASMGRANRYAAKFARFVAISYPGTEDSVPTTKDKIALTGNPIREELMMPSKEGMYSFFDLDERIPTIFILGGSSGSQAINSALMGVLASLVEKYQVIHQTGALNESEVKGVAKVVLEHSQYKNRYKAFGFMTAVAMKMASGAAQIVITRAGSGAIFEVASWGLPSIVIPIPEQISHDQVKNAYSYARAGGCVVIEEKNLTPHILEQEIERIMNTKELRDSLKAGAHTFAQPDAAMKIARVILSVALEHER